MILPNSIDLSDAYDQAYNREVEDYRHFVTILVKQIFIKHFVESGLLREKPAEAFFKAENHPSMTATYFIKKLLGFFQDRGDISIGDDGFYRVERDLSDDDPGDEKLNAHLKAHPEKEIILGILITIRNRIERVIFHGEDALLTMANDDFRQAMKLWEQLNAYAQVKVPCHHLVLRVLKKKLEERGDLRIFEGGAGVGAVLRELSGDTILTEKLAGFDRYFFTDISLSLIKISREWLKNRLPAASYEKVTFKVVNLDKMEIGSPDFVQENAFDVVIFEHVLYDLIDLHKTLVTVHRMLKPDGILVFTMAYRSRPREFFIFEFMQSTFQSYYTAKLEPEYRENIGYLTIEEWEKSIQRAGFNNYEIYPSQKDLQKWPYGGIVAYPSK